MEKTASTVPPPGPDSLNSALRRNIQALEDRRKREASNASVEARIAEAITRFTGSMRFVYVPGLSHMEFCGSQTRSEARFSAPKVEFGPPRRLRSTQTRP